jgi:DNA-binding transcriptional LysR family regulator
MNLNQLKIFYLAIRRGSLTAAAAELNITQPAVTKAIQRLQQHYDVRLVERAGRTWVPTAAGKALYRIAARIFQLENQAEDSIRSFREQGERRLRILSSETFGGYYLPEVINRYQSLHPDITVAVDILPNEKVLECTASMDNDLGFVSDPIRHKSLTLNAVLTERLVLIAAAGHPLAQGRSLRPRDLAGQPIIMHEQGSAVQKAMDALLGRNRSRSSNYLEFSNNEAIKRAVASGAGVALISEKVAAEEVRTGKLKILKLATLPIRRTFFMVLHKGKYISQALKSLIEMVDQWAAGRN